MMVVVVGCHTESTFDPRIHHTKHGHLLVTSPRGCQVTSFPTQRHSQVFILSDLANLLVEKVGIPLQKPRDIGIQVSKLEVTWDFYLLLNWMLDAGCDFIGPLPYPCADKPL